MCVAAAAGKSSGDSSIILRHICASCDLVVLDHCVVGGPPSIEVIWCMLSEFSWVMLFLLKLSLICFIGWYVHSVIRWVIVCFLLVVQYAHMWLHLLSWKCSMSLVFMSVDA